MTPQAPSTLSMLTHHVSDLAKRTSNENLDEIEDIVVKDWNQQAMGSALTMLVGALFNKERHSRRLPLRHSVVEQESLLTDIQTRLVKIDEF